MRALENFIGTYDVARIIDDRVSGAQSRFEGRASFAPDDVGLLYAEAGDLIMGAQRFRAERRYLWRASGTQIRVLFSDGAMFHDFDPQRGGDATQHLCGRDMYLGGYDFAGWPNWTLNWRVRGPRKDYTSSTRYLRASPK